MRHAEAILGNPALHDHDRPLTQQGKLAAKKMGTLLAAGGFVPNKIISSTAARARETALGVHEFLNNNIEIEYSKQLYNAKPAMCLEHLINLPDEIEFVMLVGHNPGISNILEISCRINLNMPTAAIAEIHFDIQQWNNLEEFTKGTLNNYWNPITLIC